MERNVYERLLKVLTNVHVALTDLPFIDYIEANTLNFHNIFFYFSIFFFLSTFEMFYVLKQGFPNTFLEPPQHCTFCMSALSDTHFRTWSCY